MTEADLSEAEPVSAAVPPELDPGRDTDPGAPDSMPGSVGSIEIGAASQRASALWVRGLTIDLPDGTRVVTEADLELFPGQVVSVLGPSGSGKSTLLRALLAPEELRARGYRVTFDERRLGGEVAFIPQRGALFDHLDVAGNIALAEAAAGGGEGARRWLEAVDLDPALGRSGTSVTTLSGGQAQRLAVARTLAAGRTILVLDEPSVGLDPLGVRKLAALLVEQARERGVAALLITHDLALATGASDSILYLDGAHQRLIDLLPEWPGPGELRSDSARREAQVELDEATSKVLGRKPAETLAKAKAGGGRAARAPSGPGHLRVAGAAILHALDPRLFGPSLRILRRTIGQSFLRPIPFYAVVGALLGFTVLYIIAKMSADLKTAAVLRLVGGTYILSLAPPLSAILFAATSGNAQNAWLGGMQLGRQVQALEGIGVSVPRYLWSPTWVGLVVSYLLTLGVFIAAMVGGGWLLFQLHGAKDALAILTSDFVDPAPGRGPYLVRGIWLMGAYAVAIATVAVTSGARHKDEAADVTRAMTSAVVRTTLLVVALELGSVLALFAMTGK